MAREAVDFLGMRNADQDMAEGDEKVERKPTGSGGSSPERERERQPEREKEQLPRSPVRTPSRDGEGPGEGDSRGEEQNAETETEGQGDAKRARTSPPRSPGMPSDKPPATGGFQLTEEEYRLCLHFRGQKQQLQAKLIQARQAATQDRSARVSPTHSGGEAPPNSLLTATNTSLPLSGTSIIDQHNRIVQAKFAQALQAESQHKQDSSATHAHNTRPHPYTSAAALSLAIPAAANGQHFQLGFAHQGGFGSPIPGIQRVDGRHLGQEPHLSSYMASPKRVLPQSNTTPGPRSVSPQPATPVRSNGSNVPGGRVTAQLTIFYNGQVNVYDDVPEDKARAIMLLAGSESTFSLQPPVPTVASKTPIVAPSAATAPSPTSSSGGSINSLNKSVQRARISTELPQARKVSLARFLEKRKDRARAKTPYPGNNSEKKFAPFDRPPSPPQNLSVIAHSSCPSSAPAHCASQSVPIPSIKQQLTCGEPALSSHQGHGSEDHGGVSRMRCSGVEVAGGSDGPSGTSGLQPQLQQQQLQIH